MQIWVDADACPVEIKELLFRAAKRTRTISMSEHLLRIRNHHAASSGDPSVVSADPSVYIGYFENTYGEQWIFTFYRATSTGELRGGDAGWNTVFEVRDGAADGLILSKDESAWLKACWSAAVGP